MNTATETAVPQASATARRVDELLAHYGESHRNPRNERIHFVAIPLIMLSLVGLIYAAHPLAAVLFMAASMVYYLRLSMVFLATMALVSLAMLAMVYAMGEMRVAICTGIFVGAWIAQFIGHKIEGRKPSFFEDIQYLWVGPLFVLSKLFERLGVRW